MLCKSCGYMPVPADRKNKNPPAEAAFSCDRRGFSVWEWCHYACSLGTEGESSPRSCRSEAITIAASSRAAPIQPRRVSRSPSSRKEAAAESYIIKEAEGITNGILKYLGEA